MGRLLLVGRLAVRDLRRRRVEAALHSQDVDASELAAELTDMLRRLTAPL